MDMQAWKAILKNANLYGVSHNSVYDEIASRYDFAKKMEQSFLPTAVSHSDEEAPASPLDLSRKTHSTPSSPESISFQRPSFPSQEFSESDDSPLDLRITQNSSKTVSLKNTETEETSRIERNAQLYQSQHVYCSQMEIEQRHTESLTEPSAPTDMVNVIPTTPTLRESELPSPVSKLQCHICYSSFVDKNAYHRHMTLHSTKLYSCYMCGREYKQARDYRAHVAAHKNGHIFKCDICTCILSNSSDYLLHLKTHRQKDLLSCYHCHKYFRDGCTLATHMRTHTGEKPYKCDVCGKKFRQSGTYHRHRKVHKEAILKERKVRLLIC
ncbi:transcription factor che-1-like [Watersipora subatra]|uniref:transcription factor che-1-like n=1 Tax=Watersipora subatra TaxID=2589382 RepID=UPI00355BDE13